MKATLYKLNERYVLCSDEKIIKGDTCINLAHQQIVTPTDIEWGNSNSDNLKKVLTQSPDFSLISEEDAKRIGWFDVEKLAKEFFDTERKVWESENPNGLKSPDFLVEHYRKTMTPIYSAGFQKHAELTEDKRFTEDDMINLLRYIGSQGLWIDVNGTLWRNPFVDGAVKVDVIPQFLSQPKSWEVEIESKEEWYGHPDDYSQPHGVKIVPKVVNGKIKVLKLL